MIKGKKVSELFYLGGILILVAALPLSVFMMSIAQFIIVAGWLMAGDIKSNFKSFFSNKPALIITGIYLIHILGLFITTDFNYAAKDLRIKLPLLLMPFLLSTGPALTKKNIHLILSVFVIAVLVGTVASMMVVTGILNYSISDIRDISIFISHIRFSLLICLAIFIILYLSYHYKSTLNIILSVLLILWFAIFLFIIESITGFVILSTVSFVFLILYLFSKPFSTSSFIAALMLFTFPLVCYLYLKQEYEKSTYYPQHEIEDLKTETKHGNPYTHYPDRKDVENGHIVWININWEEMKSAWNERSNYSIDSLDARGQPLVSTLIRFLTSKGFNKDREGVEKLTDSEIYSIEQGITNVDDQQMGNLQSRLKEIFWEYETYKMYGNPGGHSVMQRIEFWKASLEIIKRNVLYGVGTGDLNEEFKRFYEVSNSRLGEKWRLRSHNQYLSIGVAFGLPGVLYFIFALVYPMIKLKRYKSFLYLSFWITAVLSMIAEDTLETQAGVTFFAFFNVFYLFCLPNHDKDRDTVELKVPS